MGFQHLEYILSESWVDALQGRDPVCKKASQVVITTLQGQPCELIGVDFGRCLKPFTDNSCLAIASWTTNQDQGDVRLQATIQYFN